MTLDKASHFIAPDGTDVLVAAGIYCVEQSQTLSSD